MRTCYLFESLEEVYDWYPTQVLTFAVPPSEIIVPVLSEPVLNLVDDWDEHEPVPRETSQRLYRKEWLIRDRRTGEYLDTYVRKQ